jgi:hypothetical protein
MTVIFMVYIPTVYMHAHVYLLSCVLGPVRYIALQHLACMQSRSRLIAGARCQTHANRTIWRYAFSDLYIYIYIYGLGSVPVHAAV